ncbi:hypothetical protein NXH76_11855 [Blautia schinkii]|nr:hypothetical protein [Blautia schinkii]
MNKERRKRINDVIARLDDIQPMLEEIRSEIEQIKDEEEEYKDNIPENMQSGERYERAESACESLDEALSRFDDFEEPFGEIQGYLEEAAE